MHNIAHNVSVNSTTVSASSYTEPLQQIEYTKVAHARQVFQKNLN